MMKPMLVSSGQLKPDSDRYAFEPKWDGYRALITVSRQTLTIQSRNGFDMTSRYPELAGLKGAVSESIVLDGEIVVLNENGDPDFAALWFRNRSGADHEGQLCFVAFDVLQRGNEVLIDRPFHERRAMLEDLQLAGPHWCTTPSFVADGAALFEATRQRGLEGVVAKRVDSKYKPGIRSRSWTKTKHMQERNFALLGWISPEEWRGDRGCVVLGLRTLEGGLAVAGFVESGYGRELVEQLPQLTRGEVRRWSEPGVVCPSSGMTGRVRYLEWSTAGGLRHASIVARH
jgi:bifunctional non-homologous end joining protein LigD